MALPMKTCLKNGLVVLDDALIKTDILFENGIITAIGNANAFDLKDDDDVVDCSNQIILPGLIDAHCHIQLDTGIFATKDNWEIGSCEAAKGGITTVIDFVGPEPGEDLKHALDFRMQQAQSSIIDYTFHMTALDANEKTLKAIEQCPDWGISSLKLYTTYRPNYYLNDSDILTILQTAKKAGLTTLIHCENDAIVSYETPKHADENICRAYPDMRPAIAEIEAAQRMIRLAQYADARIVIAHNSCQKTARVVAQARAEGIQVFNETAPQYLFLNETDNKTSPEPWRYILQPPLRTVEDNHGLQSAVLFGDVDMIITDHCNYTKEQKTTAASSIPGGLPGLQTLLPLTAAIPGMTWTKVAKVLSRNPAKIYGLWGKKGAIAPGFDADVVVIDDNISTIDEADLNGFANYTPFHGHSGRGIVRRVYRRGECIVKDGKCLAKSHSGLFIHTNTKPTKKNDF